MSQPMEKKKSRNKTFLKRENTICGGGKIKIKIKSRNKLKQVTIIIKYSIITERKNGIPKV